MTRWSIFHVVAGACVILACLSNTSVADISPPPGLAPGDTFHWVFVTSTTTSAESGDIDYYNDFVQTAANASPLRVTGVQGVTSLGDITWRAIASTESVAAPYNIGALASSIHLLNGELVATGETDLWDGSIAHPISLTELMTPPPPPPPQGDNPEGTDVWTGTDRYGNAWDFCLGSSVPERDQGWRWFFGGGEAFGWNPRPWEHLPLYGISAELTVASVVPLPGAVILGVTGLISSSVVMRRRRRSRKACMAPQFH